MIQPRVLQDMNLLKHYQKKDFPKQSFDYFKHFLQFSRLGRTAKKLDFKSGQVSGCVYKIVKSDMTEVYNQVICRIRRFI